MAESAVKEQLFNEQLFKWPALSNEQLLKWIAGITEQLSSF